MQLFLRILPGSYYSLISFVQKQPSAKSLIIFLIPTLTIGIVMDSLQYDGIITLKEIVLKSLKRYWSGVVESCLCLPATE